MIKKIVIAVPVTLAVALLLVSCTSVGESTANSESAATSEPTVSSTTAAGSAAPATLKWGKCPTDVTGDGLQCKTLDVPLDYSKDDGQTIELAISRLASTDPDKRHGVLLTNSGGPGGVGLAFPGALRDLGLPESVLDTYDVIGFDPRGVGHSTPVTCDLKPELALSNIPPYARNSAEVAEDAAAAEGIAKACGSSASAPLLPYITTANTARDLDRVREALAEIWQALDAGTPVPVPSLADAAPAATDVPADNYLASQLHVICNDSDWPESVASYQRHVAADRQRSPLFGAAAANITPCAFWPSEPIEPQVKITDKGPSNVLLIQNLRDPATPLAGAQKMRKAFGDRARMVTADQGGHLGYLLLDNPCADGIATNFLVTGERPADDVACGKVM